MSTVISAICLISVASRIRSVHSTFRSSHHETWVSVRVYIINRFVFYFLAWSLPLIQWFDVAGFIVWSGQNIHRICSRLRWRRKWFVGGLRGNAASGGGIHSSLAETAVLFGRSTISLVTGNRNRVSAQLYTRCPCAYLQDIQEVLRNSAFRF